MTKDIVIVTLLLALWFIDALRITNLDSRVKELENK